MFAGARKRAVREHSSLVNFRRQRCHISILRSGALFVRFEKVKLQIKSLLIFRKITVQININLIKYLVSSTFTFKIIKKIFKALKITNKRFYSHCLIYKSIHFSYSFVCFFIWFSNYLKIISGHPTMTYFMRYFKIPGKKMKNGSLKYTTNTSF